MKPLFESFMLKVYPDYLVLFDGHGDVSVPLKSISSVQVGIMFHKVVTIRTNDGKTYTLTVWKKKEARDAIMSAMSKL